MSRRLEPVRKTVPEILQDLRDGYREAAITGPQAALKFLDRTFASQHSLPNAVKCFAYDLLAEATFQVGELERCEEAVQAVLKYLPEAEAGLGAELKRALPEMTFLERGIAVRSGQGDFEGALALCDFAVERNMGAHFEAKRDSLEWAR